MIETIPSEWMREYLKKHNRKLNDAESAAVIWNRPDLSWGDKLNVLEELETNTSDILLKKQLWERITYERESFRRYRENHLKSCVYVVIDENNELFGCFAAYETAYNYITDYIRKYGEDDLIYYKIDKQKILCSGEEAECYRSEGIAHFNPAGEMIRFSSFDEENFENPDEIRFEDLFFVIPCGMSCCCVKMPENNLYGVVNSTEKRWEAYMDTLETWSEEDRDFTDIQVKVYCLTEDGIWTHKHVNPLFLEPEMPVFPENDTIGSAFTEAVNALIAYFNEETDERAEGVIKTAKKYSELCLKKKIPQIKGIEDILR